jgi:hypothetical protein
VIPDDTSEVPTSVVVLEVRPVAHVAGADDRERLEAVQEVTSSRGDLEVGEVVPHRGREVHVDAPKGVHDILEAVEVQLDEVVDRDPEVLLDHGHQLARAIS